MAPKITTLRALLSLSPIAGPLAGVASVCAGGVCTVAAPAAVNLLALSGTATGLSGFMALGQVAGHAAAAVTHGAPDYPWINLLSLAFLGLALAWDIWAFSQQKRPYSAAVLTLTFLGLAIAETWRIPGGHPVFAQWAALALGLPLFIALPYRGQIPVKWQNWPRTGIKLLALAGLGFALLYLQGILGWQPCLLCWLERGALLLVIGLNLSMVLRRFPVGVALAAGAADALAAFQFLEFKQAVTPPVVCSTLTVSCTQAAGNLLLGFPVIYWTMAFFALLFALALMVTPENKGTT